MNYRIFGEDWFYEPYTFRRGRTNYGKIYFSYCVIGSLSFLSLWVLALAIILWGIAVLGIKKMTLRSWVASVLGLITPYWIKFGLTYLG